MSEKKVAAGLSSANETVGLTGLVPFEILTLPEAKLRPEPGVVRVMVTLPSDRKLDPTRPITYRVHGGEAGFEFDRNGQIVNVRDATLPLVIPYTQRMFPAPPVRSEMALDLTFWHTDGTPAAGQDVQWRVPVRWDAAGTTRLDLNFEVR